MQTLDYIVILLYFAGLILVSGIMSRRIKSSEDMFIAGRNSSWWLSGVSTYMTIFSASTFVVWGGVAYKSGLVAAVVAYMFTIASLIVGKWIAGKWRKLRIKSPGEFLTIRFGQGTVSFYTISGIIGRGIHTAVALYAVAVVMCTLIRRTGRSSQHLVGPSDSWRDHSDIYDSRWIPGGADDRCHTVRSPSECRRIHDSAVFPCSRRGRQFH